LHRLDASISKAAILILAALGWAGSARANGFTIVPTYDSTITGLAGAATIENTIGGVISNFESLITTTSAIGNVTIHVTFANMTTGLASTSSTVYAYPYNLYLSALSNTLDHAQSADDQTALAQLIPDPKNLPTNPPVGPAANIELRGSLMKVLGIATASAKNAVSEGTISLNTAIMNLSRTGAQNSSYYDLQEAVTHELDEVLGLGSSLGPALSYISPEDLYRYSATGGSSAPCSTVSGRSYSASAAACFSIDGKTGLAQFNNSGTGDSGDWLTGAKGFGVQVQDASGTPGSQPNLGTEIRALDVIGYTLTSTITQQGGSQTAAPEPATALLFGPVLLAGIVARRARNRHSARSESSL
jgi:hypothetical protein